MQANERGAAYAGQCFMRVQCCNLQTGFVACTGDDVIHER